MGETAVLAPTGQGSPGVPFMGLTVLTKSVCDGVVPPNKVSIKGYEPIPKGGSQLAV